MELLASFFTEKIFEILVGVIVTFNIGAYTFLWRRFDKTQDETQKNTETLNMILQRIFGIKEDPTDEGYIMETEHQFDCIEGKLQDIAERQEEYRRESRKEHEEVNGKMTTIVDVLVDEEQIDITRDDFRDK